MVQSLVIASEGEFSDIDAHSIYKATRALVFFATPHRGLSTEDILRVMDGENFSERVALLKSLDKNSELLQLKLESFIKIAPHFKIYSFYEQMKTRGLVAVCLTTYYITVKRWV